MKMEFATLFLGEKVDNWFKGWMSNHRQATWKEFMEAICGRFGELNSNDVVE
ncbi:conserved hypothetical protein [Ricinus communis]|uniref:Retrotransposon gag domain-containing protein n=1 Tax=Ricinus communis TaxID=3988 RepID=B9S6I5_RICCO|nr:conserved hypothetical protein [Ricinus communis]